MKIAISIILCVCWFGIPILLVCILGKMPEDKEEQLRGYVDTVDVHSFYTFMDYDLISVWRQIENYENICFRLTVKEKTKFDKLKERWIDAQKGA